MSSKPEHSKCYNPLCEEELSNPVSDDVEGYCSWECAVMARSGAADRIRRKQEARAR